MCATLANAISVLDHSATPANDRGYTRTLHHIGHLSPGDLWRPVEVERPRTVTAVHRHQDEITLADQQGSIFAYPTACVVATAVRDPLPALGYLRGGPRL